jgi:hypothetical protein
MPASLRKLKFMCLSIKRGAEIPDARVAAAEVYSAAAGGLAL